MKPKEFWQGEYREIYLFCEAGMIRIQEDFKQNIILNDATTDKLIQAHPLNPKSKIVSITKAFPKLFKAK